MQAEPIALGIGRQGNKSIRGDGRLFLMYGATGCGYAPGWLRTVFAVKVNKNTVASAAGWTVRHVNQCAGASRGAIQHGEGPHLHVWVLAAFGQRQGLKCVAQHGLVEGFDIDPQTKRRRLGAHMFGLNDACWGVHAYRVRRFVTGMKANQRA